MMNIIRADLYRIIRSKGFYITIVLLLTFVFLQTATSSKGGINIKMTDEPGPETIEELLIAPEAFVGSTAPFELMENTDNLLYFLLPFIVFIAAADFSAETAKNVLSNGMSRTKYYLSKLILSCVFCVLILLAQIVISIIAATALRGFGGTFGMEFLGRLLRPFSAQLFMCLAVNCVGMFFVFVTRRTAAVNGAYIAFCILPFLIMAILFQINDKLVFLFKYDVPTNVKMLAHIDLTESIDIIRAFTIGLFYIVASTLGGIAIFKKAEIK